MSVLPEDQMQQVRDLVCEHLEVEPGELNETEHFVDGYGADSLSLIDLAAAMEKEFNVVIEQDDLPKMVNLAAVYEVAQKYMDA
jgi:acyl carrier protein